MNSNPYEHLSIIFLLVIIRRNTITISAYWDLDWKNNNYVVQSNFSLPLICILFLYFLPFPPSLKQTRSFLLGPHLKNSIKSSMKADASLQPGTWRAYRAAAPSTRFLYPMAWTMTPMFMTSTFTMVLNPGTRPTCSAPQRAAQWTSTTVTRRAAPSTLTAWWCPLS